MNLILITIAFTLVLGWITSMIVDWYDKRNEA
jgi:hypothetical protein